MASTTLATRCPACQTVFRVVPDQLRVSQGWVRCGRCAEVFNATLSLVDIETGAPRQAAEVLSPSDLGIEVVAAHEDPTSTQPRAAEAEAETQALHAAEPDPSTAPVDDAGVAPQTADAAGQPERIEPPFDAPAASDADAAITPEATGGAAPEDTAATLPIEAPSFVRQAERAARWRQPRVRTALAVLGSLAAVTLLGQILHEYRDLAAARFPGIRPGLESTCALLGCRIEPARAINSLAVESSGLVRIERSSIYRLQVALRNRAGIEVALPFLDLSFTDSQGRLIARKVLRPTELGTSLSTLGAGRELALQTTLQAGPGEPISGYTIELFYP